MIAKHTPKHETLYTFHCLTVKTLIISRKCQMFERKQRDIKVHDGIKNSSYDSGSILCQTFVNH